MNHTIKASAALLSILLAGCSMNPQTGNYEANRTGIGLAVGTAVGAAAGAALGDGSYALKGAMIGAAVGGGTGYYLEKKHRELQAQLQQTDLEVEMARDESGNQVLVVSAPADVSFSVGSAALAPESFHGLSTLARSLQNQNVRIEIVGHTDSSGDHDRNQQLSYARAKSVAEYLYQSGVPMNQLFVRGAGYSEPKADNATPQGRAKNRRVEIVVRT